jgi:hypothetical protein
LCDWTHSAGHFNEIDFTCPTICQRHRDENERRGVGPRMAGTLNIYPFTHQRGRGVSGYTAYRRLRHTRALTQALNDWGKRTAAVRAQQQSPVHREV